MNDEQKTREQAAAAQARAEAAREGRRVDLARSDRGQVVREEDASAQDSDA